MLVHNVEGALESDASGAESSLFKQTTNQSDTVRDAAWRTKFWQRILGVGSPVAASFGDLDETSAQSERRLAGKVGDGEHFVAQGRNEQHVNLIEDVDHFFGDFAA